MQTSTIQIDIKTPRFKYIVQHRPCPDLTIPLDVNVKYLHYPGVKFLQHVPLRPAACRDGTGGEGGGDQGQRLHRPPHFPIQQLLLLSAQAISGV